MAAAGRERATEDYLQKVVERTQTTRPNRPGGKQRLEATDREGSVREADPLPHSGTTSVVGYVCRVKNLRHYTERVCGDKTDNEALTRRPREILSSLPGAALPARERFPRFYHRKPPTSLSEIFIYILFLFF